MAINAPSFTASGAKSTSKIALDKDIFGVEVKSHDLLKNVYTAHLSNSRVNLARTKTRGEVVGSTKKPWKQKGTGRARFGSRYNPIWRGGGITFGPTGNENYTKKVNTKAKRQALKQALSLAGKDGNIIVIDSFKPKDNKTAAAVRLLGKFGAKRRVLIAVGNKTAELDRSVRNIPDTKLVQAKYLNTYDVLNADAILIEKAALEEISNWLGGTK